MSLTGTSAEVPTAAPQRASRIEPFETILLIFGLMVISGMFRSLLSGGGDREAGSALQQLVLFTIYGGGLAFMLVGGITREFIGLVKRSWPLLLLTFLTLASVLWSDAPSTSLRRAVALILTLTFAYYIVGRFTMKEVMSALFWVFIAYMVVGAAASVLLGNMNRTGAFEGWTGQKNEFGRILAAIIAFAIVFRHRGTTMWRTWWLPVTIFALALLILSQSKTSIVSAMAGICASAYFTFYFLGNIGRYRFSPEVRIVSGAIILFLALFMVFIGLPIIVELLGRDLTLSGRTSLWRWAISLGWSDPWLGSGYRTFWIDANTFYFAEFFSGWFAGAEGERVSTGPGNGHNGYLDVWLELGFVGLGALVVFFGAVVGRIKHCLQSGRMFEGSGLALLFGFMLVYSITERIILQHSELVWFLLITFYVYSDPVYRQKTARI
jgi:O-antigen ligase